MVARKFLSVLGGYVTHHFVPGDRLGRYELVNILGGGGFASVWRARTAGLGGFERAVAIKVIRPGRAAQKRFQDMLLDEARLVARIQHPNVTQIWEVGEDPRSLYVVMELVEGASLDELRSHAENMGIPLPVRALIRILADICGGLHVAHELTQDGVSLGLVHRDISPQNILVSRHGVAKLIDFGIAKAKERLISDTTTGFIKGKISYMAPEQARSEEVDRRADIWAVGAVAFDLIEGHPPFDGPTEVGRLAALVSTTPCPALQESVPAPIRAVIQRSLEKDRDLRYPTALALKEALEEALIESEMETSSEQTALLLARHFHPNVLASEVSLDGKDPGTASVERPVSSTIEARFPSDTVQLPLNRPRYGLLALGVLAAISFGAWALLRNSQYPSGTDEALNKPLPTTTPASSKEPGSKITALPSADPTAQALATAVHSATSPIHDASTAVAAARPAPQPTTLNTQKPSPAATVASSVHLPKPVPTPVVPLPSDDDAIE